MRINIKLSSNKEIVPFNYQRSLVGALHRWIGKNEIHDDISLYSLSWLRGGKMRYDKRGLDFKHGALFSISAPSKELLNGIIQGIFKGTAIRWGMEVTELQICLTPNFGEKYRFMTSSPVLIKRKIDGEKHDKYFFAQDEDANEYLTETLRHKLEKARINTDVNVMFDPNYRNPKIKMINYNGIDIKATFCPVIVEGDPRAVQFAWEVGVGNSTGIGFGCLM